MIAQSGSFARSTAAASVVLLLLAACTRGSGVPSPTSAPPSIDPIHVKVAYLEDATVENAFGRVAPAMQGMKLAFTVAASSPTLPVHADVVAFDTQGDASRALDQANEIAADPAFVAVAIAPFWSEPPEVADVLRQAGLPTFDLSPLGPTLGAEGGWWRIVAPEARQAQALATSALAAGDSAPGVCMAGDATSYADQLAQLVKPLLGSNLLLETSMPADQTPYPAELAIATAGCGTVLWTGFGDGAARLRATLVEVGLRDVRVVGADALKDDRFLSAVGSAGEGTIVSCACVDLSTSTEAVDQRFIHDFQSANGQAPGVYAVEGYDVGGMLLRAFRGGLSTRELLTQVFPEGPGPYDGLAGRYEFGADGELVASSARVNLFRDQGLTWVSDVQGDPGRLALRTPGTLTVGSCRSGPPFAYREHGTLTGFDVELATEIASRLELTVSWKKIPCAATADAVASGRIDIALLKAKAVPATSPVSRIFLSIHAAVTMRASASALADPFRSLRGKVVAVAARGEAATWAQRQLRRRDGARLRTYADPSAAYDALTAGRVAAVVDEEPNAWSQIEDRPRLRVVASIDVGDHGVIDAGAFDTTLLAAVDGALGQVIGTGTYAALFAKYFPGTPIPDETGS